MANKATYRAWVINNGGASCDVRGSFSSKRAAEDAARAQFGSGWKVTVTKIEHDGESGWFAPVVVKTFTIR